FVPRSITFVADRYCEAVREVQQIVRSGGLVVQVDCRGGAHFSGRLCGYQKLDRLLPRCVPYDRARNPLPQVPAGTGRIRFYSRRSRVPETQADALARVADRQDPGADQAQMPGMHEPDLAYCGCSARIGELLKTVIGHFARPGDREAKPPRTLD